MDFYALAEQCSPQINEKPVVAAIAHTESKFNPYAIGLVGGYVRQPKTLAQAISTVRQLQKDGRNFSVGISQVNKSNFIKYGLNESNMFDPCTNLKAGMSIYKDCFDAADRKFGSQYSYDGKLRLAASCYYSGNFTTGFKADFPGQPPYVTKFYNRLVGYRSSQLVAQPQITQVKVTQHQAQQSQPIVTNRDYMPIVNAIKQQKQALAMTQNNQTDDIEAADSQAVEAQSTPITGGDVFTSKGKDVFHNLNRGV